VLLTINIQLATSAPSMVGPKFPVLMYWAGTQVGVSLKRSASEGNFGTRHGSRQRD
jgi:hypothetical protein